MKTPDVLDRIADKVLAYHPPDKPLRPARKKRAKKPAKVQNGKSRI